MSEEIQVNVCMGTGGIAGGGGEVLEAFQQQFKEAGINGRIEKKCAAYPG